jgi:hypothetical protein
VPYLCAHQVLYSSFCIRDPSGPSAGLFSPALLHVALSVISTPQIVAVEAILAVSHAPELCTNFKRSLTGAGSVFHISSRPSDGFQCVIKIFFTDGK